MKRSRCRCEIALPGAEGRAEVVETGQASGRTVVAAAAMKKGDIVCTVDASSIAFAKGLTESDCMNIFRCSQCGYDSGSGVCRTKDWGTGKSCNQCTTRRHNDKYIGECHIFSQWYMLDHATEEEKNSVVPPQLLLAYRILTRDLYYHDESAATGNPFDLAGDASDCDEARVEMVEWLMKCIDCASTRAKDCEDDKYRDAMSQIAARVTRSQVLKVLGIIHRNAFKIEDGLLALFPGAALFNHCCGPNAVMTVEYVCKGEDIYRDNYVDIKDTSYRGLCATIRCIEDVRKGEEITISYVPLALYPREQRQQAVMVRHDFLCACSCCASGMGEGPLQEQGVLSIGDMKLSVDPLVEMLEEAEELLQHDGADLNDVNFLLTQAESGAENLKLGPMHYLRMKGLYLRTEFYQLKKDFENVHKFSTEWLSLLHTDLGATFNRLCDPHYKCRMLVLCAEASYQNAIKHASAIYGDDYALVRSLQRQRGELANSTSSPPSPCIFGGSSSSPINRTTRKSPACTKKAPATKKAATGRRKKK